MMIGPMKKKMITVGIVSFLIPTAILGVLFLKYHKDKEAEIDSLEQEVDVAERYVFSGDLPVNHIVGENDIKKVTVKESSIPLDSYSITPSDDLDSILGSPIGRKLKIPVFDKTIISESMFYTEDDNVNRDERQKEFNMITIPSDLEEGDYIDIRMMHPTGEDFLVVSAKEVKQLGLNAETNTIFLDLNEDELIRLSAAIVESYIENSIHLYAVKYVNSKQQLFEEVKVDYVEKYAMAVQQLISGDYEKQLANEGAIPVRKTVFDFTIEQIAAQAGIDLEVAKRIQEANGEVDGIKDEKLLTYYRNQTKVISKPLVANYPIKKEIYTLIQKNPNILETVKQKYNVEELIQERENLINTSIYKTDEYTGEIIKDEDVLNNVITNITEEIETQKSERKEYLQNMIRNNISEN